ncbi:MAG: TldD/PmbA family protein, partial [Spirochaetota bacterium]
MSAKRNLESRWNRATELLLGELIEGEELSLEYACEDSRFLRFNEGRVRQIGAVEKAELEFTYFRGGRTLHSGFALTGDPATDDERAAVALGAARAEAALLPE